MKNKHLEPIAVVGIGAIMPGALTKDEFWSNIKEGKYCITEIPASYWDYKLFYSPDHKAEDKLYSKIGGFIPQTFKFNSLKYRIPPQIAKQMDTVQHLAIETTRMALEDSGYDKKEFDHNRTAVIIGNSMGGMKNEMSNTRLNRPFLYEILKNTPTYKSLAPADAQKMLDEMDAGVREKFTPVNEDSMPGELANVIPGRVANVFDLHGTNFAVDAACATSLAAIDQAVNGLRMGNFDMAIAGGVDQMMSPSAYIKFCKIGALSEKGSCPFDAKADGFVMAEGAGMVILKRLSDAVKDGDKIYAVIRAVGASSDGKGKGITAPNPKGQKIAVEKAFEQVEYTPGDVGLVEAHGTSTRVGDAVELNALNEIFSAHAKPGTIGLGSVKSQIGHAKAAAGIASLIKTSLALYNKVLPPSVNFETPNPTVNWATCPFRVITKLEDWNTDKVRRANVSAFGFGGTNFHVAMEEMNDGLLKKEEEAKSQENKVCHCAVPSTPKQENVNMTYTLHVPGEKIQSDVLTFSAATKQELFNVLDKALVAIQYDPTYLPSISYKNHIAKPGKFAVTINVESPEKLKDKIEFFKKTASSQDVWEQESLYLRMKGIYPFTPSEIKPKVCFMFPGQGSQYVDMMKDLASKYKIVQDTFDEADRLLTNIIGQTLTETLWSKPGETKEKIAEREAAIKKTEMTQPAVLTADIAMMRLLSSFGIKPDVVMGHSLGEYAAAVAAGIFDFENGLKAVCTRGKVMSEIKVEDNGKMASIAAPVERVEPELVRISGYVAVANKNCPTQTVIAGASKSIDDAIKMFTDMGIQAVQIPVSHAFHSAIVRPAMPQYRAFLDTLKFNAPTMPITTNVTAEFYPSDPEKIKDLMVTQISHSVEWIKQLQTTYDSGVRLFVECGPKRVLSALASNTLSDKKDIKVLASNHPKKGGIVEFNDLFANLISSGIHLDWNGTDMYGNNSTFNPAFVNWVTGNATPVEKAEGTVTAPVAEAPACAGKVSAADNGGKKSIVISGIAAGGPGSWDKIFREGVLDEILSGRNMIEPVSAEIQQKQIDKHVEFVIKSKDGNHRFERLTSPMQAIKLAAKGGAFDLEKEFGLPAKWVRSMDRSFQLAIAAGILALKDAGIPLVLYYKPTSTGGYLPDRWGLPADMIDETGVIFTSAFPVANSMMGDLSKRVAGLLNNKTAKEVRAFCDKFIAQISDPALKAEIEAWYQANFKDKEVEPEAFTSEFILKTIIIAHSHFCQWIRARGPATAMSAACASTAQAISVAQDWIKLGRCKRVIVISADDITNDNVSEWILTAFLASGAATTEADVTKAALPFDRRRNGMIVGMGAVSLIVEDEAEVAKRGMKPLAKLLSTEISNSGFHVTRLDVGHVAQVMNRLVATAEKEYGLDRSDIAKQLVFISHETYTPARGGSASAEAYALKSTFGADVSSVIVSNTKGFTGHSMGAGLEDAIAVRCLNTGLVPPIANFKEADPELEGITLSKGGHYNFKYALRLAAGFGSQLGMTLLEKVWQVGDPRITDEAKHQAWLKEISGQQAPVLEVVQNTLRIKDNYQHGVKPALVMEGSQAFVDKVKTVHAHTAAQPAPVAAQPAVAAAPKAVALDEATVTKEVVKMVGEKTGYPEDMLDIDLDMEADLGIDTVKQAELFASLREHYGIAQQDGIQLKDYPTIRHCIKFVLNNAGASAAQPAVVPQATVAPAPVAQPAPVAAPAPQATVAPVAAAKPAAALDEATVTKEVVAMVAEKTGYPEDMLDIDLDMEADLGIDTVKQAELFASLREHYGIAQQDGIQLKDYPTIRHCIKFVLNNAGASEAPAAQSAPVMQAAVTPAPAVAPVAAPAPQATVAPVISKPAAALDEATVTKEVVAMVAEKTGYPEDMLDIDLDMEADLGIDTVKQAELFASLREHYGIAQQDGIQLKDYPTIRHCINFALNNAGGAASAAPVVAPAPTAQPAPVVAPVVAPQATVAPKAAALDEATVTKEVVAMVAEKTGYPEDMLELDLDMEADLGIDTVKQAELFAAMREHYGIAQQDGIQLKDYPTIRHCIKFVLSNAGAASAAPVAAPAPAAQPVAQPAPVAAPAPQATVATKPAAALDEATVTKEVVAMVAEKTGYPEDMLDLDLDMEADLGIDTVKQAELFAAMREHYGIAQQEGIQLKDYPTIRHCINFALNNAGAASAAPVAAPASAAQPASQATVAPAAETAPAAQAPAQPAVVEQDNGLPKIHVATVQEAVPAADKVEKPSEDMLTTNPTAPIKLHESLAER
ncbi:MAG: beta-ketoacyl synthase N-terminal-like domain-containing protein, partial [Elusimicrobiaceae bacterium]|nr:beta-ketoacyl synthase N-terminal-like domain-containing protein [Elusimicrobiaceae bacterium]